MDITQLYGYPRYNGYFNYATWKVQLEVLDGLDPRAVFGEGWEADLQERLKDYAYSVVIGDAEGLVADFARATLDDVSWGELAQLMIDAY